MNYDLTHYRLYSWAAKAMEINHVANPRGTWCDPAVDTALFFWCYDQDAKGSKATNAQKGCCWQTVGQRHCNEVLVENNEGVIVNLLLHIP